MGGIYKESPACRFGALDMRGAVVRNFTLSPREIALMATSIAVAVGLSWLLGLHSTPRVVEFDMKYAISYYSNQVA